MHVAAYLFECLVDKQLAIHVDLWDQAVSYWTLFCFGFHAIADMRFATHIV